MSTPIKYCRPLFENLATYAAAWSHTPLIPKYRLDVVLAGIILSEKQGSFNEQDLMTKLTEWGYKITSLAGLRKSLPRIVDRKIFLEIRPREYKFNKKALKTIQKK